jgi:micrococcal nuclease
MNKKHIIIAIIFIASAFFYHQITDPIQTQTSQVSKVIDGDTIELTTGRIVRLKGINTPEKSMPFNEEATDFLTQLIENKTINLETYGVGKYGRTLAHIFLEDQGPAPTHIKLKSVRVNINKQILQQGLGTLYYYKEDHHYEKLKQAEEFARLNQKGLWQKSPDSSCIEITEFKTDEPESLTLKNTCNKILNITFKDDATHIYHATINPNSTFTKEFSHIWNNDGDTIYIHDTKGLLLFHRY